MTDNERLADLLFGSNGLTPEDCELRFPPRELPEGARVTRFSPSPTGYLHIGGLFGALVDFLTARVSGGLTYLRIEDTDKKREVADGVSAIINGFKNFGLEFDEGVTGFDTEKGAYGPYTQSKRVEIYHAVAKRLVQEGKAYPCFCTADELAAIREEQENGGAAITGYFGKWAKCRHLLSRGAGDSRSDSLRPVGMGRFPKHAHAVDMPLYTGLSSSTPAYLAYRNAQKEPIYR